VDWKTASGAIAGSAFNGSEKFARSARAWSAAVAVRAARAAVRTVATGGAIHVEPIGEACPAIAAGEGIVGAAGEANGDKGGKEHGGEPMGHDFNLILEERDERRPER